MVPSAGVESVDRCPVDHKTREKWLEVAKAKGQSQVHHHHQQQRQQQQPHVSTSDTSLPPTRYSLDTGLWVPAVFSPAAPTPKRPKLYRLSTDREISTIPRAASTSPLAYMNPAERAALPASAINNEHSATHDPTSGNWIYPSQEQFFNAMRRKGHAAEPTDMSSIVPIHNAVNERAWKEIQGWEKGWGAEKCGGPRLISFAGDSKALTPRARWNILLGYAPPFDRHDWVIERCGKEVGYVIDFYSGKNGTGAPGKNLNFHLDVRPKLNSWDGIKMRVARTFGWS